MCPWTVPTVLFCLSVASTVQAIDDHNFWTDTVAWMQSHGATVHPGLRANLTHHGGALIRGIVAEGQLHPAEVLLSVPKRLWLSADKFPEVMEADLSKFEHCHLDKTTIRFLKLSTGIAREVKRGNSSFWFPYLKTLPTLSDFESFHPRLAGQDILSDFWALPIAKEITGQQQDDNEASQCFQRWQQEAPADDIVRKLSWRDVEQSLFWCRTRCNNVGDHEPALMPGFDLINTEKQSLLNADWQVPKQETQDFILSVGGHSMVQPGEELLEPYCRGCDNSKILLRWGAYLEDNPVTLDNEQIMTAPGDPANCTTLRAVAETRLVLDIETHQKLASKQWKSPRCKDKVLATERQGPLRCSLARLSWEQCASNWGYVAKVLPVPGMGTSQNAIFSPVNSTSMRRHSALRRHIG